MTPSKAIKKFCCSSCCDSAQQARTCPLAGCELHPFRLGHNPNRQKAHSFNSTLENGLPAPCSKTDSVGVDVSTSGESEKGEHEPLRSYLPTIRAYCLACCLKQPHEVAACPSSDCPLHPFRLGKNPYRTPRVLSEEQRERLIQTFANSRETALTRNIAVACGKKREVLE